MILMPNAQAGRYCSPNGTACCSNIDIDSLGCRVSCTGLYADTIFVHDKEEQNNMFQRLQDAYMGYKNNFVPNLEFDHTKDNLSIIIHPLSII
jgi:hypothetical protein